MNKIFWSEIIIVFSSFYFQKSFCDLFSRTYAGNKTAEECLTGPRNPSLKYQLTTPERIELEGYPVENHLVLTEDGYLLTLQRIPGLNDSKPVLLQHGLLLNSYYWIANGKEQSLPFFLADHGFDVWLGNFRGSQYSRCHTNLTTSDRKFWDYSFHEIGLYDLPVMISYIANVTSNTIEYLGHSMGTTAFYIFAAERPNDALKVSTMHSFGATAIIKHMKSTGALLLDLVNFYGPIMEVIGAGDVAVLFETSIFKYFFEDLFCGSPVTREICKFMYVSAYGFNWAQTNASRLPEYLNHYLEGASVKSIYHYSQLKSSGKFQYYDNGATKNLELYGKSKPPNYNLTNIKVPMAIYKGANDYLCTLQDVDLFVDFLPNVVFNYIVQYPDFNHMDFVLANDAKEILYETFLKVLNRNK